ncbi:hypothetical protein NFI95_02335 [Acetobacteraceae bacterium KSS8]|uniref:Uncharacterized protein n=1 Tax=Endosaccharibacter trunci TaxID=2812733 RepID=A0ABT1W337_9PROT|nr:hypothetical protein [Acetobacteraceae bacterium KSS8]
MSSQSLFQSYCPPTVYDGFVSEYAGFWTSLATEQLFFTTGSFTNKYNPSRRPWTRMAVST